MMCLYDTFNLECHNWYFDAISTVLTSEPAEILMNYGAVEKFYHLFYLAQ